MTKNTNTLIHIYTVKIHQAKDASEEFFKWY